jgi:hypothetical protein
MSRDTLARLLTLYIFEGVREKHPEMTFLQAMGAAEAGAIKIASAQPNPVPERVAQNAVYLVSNDPRIHVSRN